MGLIFFLVFASVGIAKQDKRHRTPHANKSRELVCHAYSFTEDPDSLSGYQACMKNDELYEEVHDKVQETTPGSIRDKICQSYFVQKKDMAGLYKSDCIQNDSYFYGVVNLILSQETQNNFGNCEEVTDSYVICNGVRYLRDNSILDQLRKLQKVIPGGDGGGTRAPIEGNTGGDGGGTKKSK